jgi:hypothetical protein
VLNLELPACQVVLHGHGSFSLDLILLGLSVGVLGRRKLFDSRDAWIDEPGEHGLAHEAAEH